MKSHTARNHQHAGLIKYLLPLITLIALPLLNCGLLFGTEPISGTLGHIRYTDYGTHVVITACSNSATVVDIPSSINYHPVTGIEDWAFYNTHSLTSVNIPNSVTSIGHGAFSWCISLTSVCIPSSVTSVGDSAFSDCHSLTGITVDSANSTYSSVDGVLYNKAQTVLVQYPGGKTVSTYSIPGSVTIIGDKAFYGCANLTSVGIANSVTSIGDRAFSYCINLISISIANSVTTIGDQAFSYCRSLTSVSIPNSVNSIRDWAFSYCDSLRSAYFEGNAPTSFGVSVFSNTDSSFTIYYRVSSGGFTSPSWRDYPARTYEPSGPITGTLGVLSYADYGTYVEITNCSDSATEVDIPTSINNHPVTSIGYMAFANSRNLTKTSIPNSVASIGRQAFAYCTNLTSVSIPNSVTSIGDLAFESCISMNSVSIPSGVTSIGDYAFANCTSLTSVSIPKGCTGIGQRAFSDCSKLIDIIVDSDNSTYSSLDGILFNISRTVLIQYPTGKTDSTYVIPDGISSIGDYAFSSCANLTNVSIPNSITSIGSGAFSWCISLYSLSIPNSVTSIGEAAFAACSSLTSVSIPNSVSSISKGTFGSCINLSSVSIPSSITSIANEAFYYCTSLTSAYFEGKAPTYFGTDVFTGTASGFTIYYLATSSGFTSPHWKYYVSHTYELNRTLSLSGNLAFVNVQVNQAATRTLTIANTGNSTVTVTSISYPAGFSGDWSGGSIPMGGSQEVAVTFLPTTDENYTGTITVNADYTGGTNTINCSSIATPVSIFQNYEKAYNAWCVTGAGFLYDAYYPFVYSANLESWWYIYDMANNGTDDSFYFYDFRTEHFSYASRSYYPYYFEYDGTSEAKAKLFP